MAKKNANTDVIELEAEEMTEVPVSEQLEKAINKEIAKFNPFEARLNELKEKYKETGIKDIDDRDGYEETRIAIGELRKIRTGTANDKKIIKAPFLAACSSIEDKSKWIISEVEKIENVLQARKDEIDLEKEKIKQERLRRESERLVVRSAQLLKMGATFDGTSYTLEDVSYDLALIRESDEEIYTTNILPKYDTIFQQKEAIRLETERVRNEQLAAEKKEREEFERQQAELKRQQEELREKQIAEDKKEQQRIAHEERVKAEQKRAMFAERLSKLKGWNFNGLTVSRNNDIFGSVDDLVSLPSDEFEALVTKNDAEVSEMEAISAKKALEVQHERERIAVAKALQEEKERQQEANRLAELKKQQEADKKQAELDAAGDKTKWAETVNYLKKCPLYDMRSGQYRTKSAILREKIDELIEL